MIKLSGRQERKNRVLRLYLTELSKYPLLTLSQEKALGCRIQKGDEAAVAELVKANLRFVVKTAKEYRGRGLSLLDLINEGNLGMIHAAWRYDPSRDVKFISYAVWWIRESISRSLTRLGRPLRLPAFISNTLYKVNKVQRKKTLDLERSPTIEEVASDIGIGVPRLTSILKFGEYVYLNQIISDKDDVELVDLLKAPHLAVTTDPISMILCKQIHQVLAELTIQEEKVLKLRYGIEDEMTLQEIGDLLGLSRERVRQIEVDALRKCKKRLGA